MTYKVFDLFCGAGCFSEGFRQAGFKICGGLDNNITALTTFQRNFPEATIFNYDILQFPFKLLPKHIDVVIGSPPCTEFSVGNINRTWDISLVEAFLDIVEKMKPKYYVMENVPDVVNAVNPLDMKFRGKFPTQLILNAHHFGAATLRTRFFGGKFPKDVKKKPRSEWKCVSDVININRPGFCQPFKELVYRKINPNKPLFTICSQRIGNERYLLPNGTSLELSELATCQGLPDHWVFPCSRSEAQRQLGNGVVPQVARSIAEAIIRNEKCCSNPVELFVDEDADKSKNVQVNMNGHKNTL